MRARPWRDHGAGGTGRPASNGKYGPLDPWAYSYLHHNEYGPLDPWAYSVLQHQQTAAPAVPLITEHSAGQNALGQSTAGPSTVVATSPAGGFHWVDPAIGAAGALALTLLAAGTIRAVRRTRGRVAPVGG